MKRREFITLLGGAAVRGRPRRARSSTKRMRTIGVCCRQPPIDAEFQSWGGAFLQGLAQMGWITGQNIGLKIDETKSTPRILANMRPNWWRSRPT